MSEKFSKESIKENHRIKIREILQNGGSVDEIVNYLMSRISTVISYERRKNERRNMREWSKNHETKKSMAGEQ
jgi:cytochrome c-type biogenesis protein CcmH/NrfF